MSNYYIKKVAADRWHTNGTAWSSILREAKHVARTENEPVVVGRLDAEVGDQRLFTSLVVYKPDGSHEKLVSGHLDGL